MDGLFLFGKWCARAKKNIIVSSLMKWKVYKWIYVNDEEVKFVGWSFGDPVA